MKKRLISFLMAVVLCVPMLASHVCATDGITITSVTFEEYKDSLGDVDATTVTIKVNITAPAGTEQVSLLLATEDISDITDQTNAKILYIDQTANPSNGILEFPVEKARIQTALGTDDIDGCTMYVKVGTVGLLSPAAKTVTFFDPAIPLVDGDVTGEGDVDFRDAIQILRCDAGLRTLSARQLAVADVTGEGDVDFSDAIRILRYDAGLIASLK